MDSPHRSLCPLQFTDDLPIQPVAGRDPVPFASLQEIALPSQVKAASATADNCNRASLPFALKSAYIRPVGLTDYGDKWAM
jgi:hypothetical protein